MTKKMTLKWRLGKLPTSNEVIELVSNKVITQEEAREILFSTSEEDTENLKSEIKFLRELINNLSDRNTIVEKIRYIEKPYQQQWGWYQPYYTYCNGGVLTTNGSNTVYLNESSIGTGTTLSAGMSTNASSALSQSNLSASSNTGTSSIANFSDIKTF